MTKRQTLRHHSGESVQKKKTEVGLKGKAWEMRGCLSTVQRRGNRNSRDNLRPVRERGPRLLREGIGDLSLFTLRGIESMLELGLNFKGRGVEEKLHY